MKNFLIIHKPNVDKSGLVFKTRDVGQVCYIEDKLIFRINGDTFVEYDYWSEVDSIHDALIELRKCNNKMRSESLPRDNA